MLDAGYFMLDIPELAVSEIQKHPDFGELSRVVSRIPACAFSSPRPIRLPIDPLAPANDKRMK